MKKSLILFLALSALITGALFSQQKTAVKLNLFSPIFKTGSFFVEHKIANPLSLQLGFLFTDAKLFEDFKVTGYALTPELRYYPQKNESVKGFYIATFLRYRDWKISNVDSDAKGKINVITPGLLIGGQFIFGNFIVLDVFIGPNYNFYNLSVESGSEEDLEAGSLKGFGIRGGVCIGIAF